MADYRRYRVERGVYFFTLVTCNRARLFDSPVARKRLGDVLRECNVHWPFTTDAIVLLPEHLHTIWTLPRNDAAYSMRWAWIKKEFTKSWRESDGREQRVSPRRRQRGDAGIWQPRFWEHSIRDEQDFDRHFDYIHYNPVKHGHVDCPTDWPHSSFHRWVQAGVYDLDWGCSRYGQLTFDDLAATAIDL